MNLPLISINAAEELQRLNLSERTLFENTNKLSDMLLKDFKERFDYSKIFSQAYFLTYHKVIPSRPKENSIFAMDETSRMLKEAYKLPEKELQNLKNLCINISDCSAVYDENKTSF